MDSLSFVRTLGLSIGELVYNRERIYLGLSSFELHQVDETYMTFQFLIFTSNDELSKSCCRTSEQGVKVSIFTCFSCHFEFSPAQHILNHIRESSSMLVIGVGSKCYSTRSDYKIAKILRYCSLYITEYSLDCQYARMNRLTI